MADQSSKVWTKNLTSGTLTILESFGLSIISIVLISGTGSIKGSLSVAGQDSDVVALTVGVPITISAPGNYLLDGIDITASGAVQIIASK